MNTIVEKDCLTFKDIEKEIFKYVCQIAVDLTKESLAEYDKKLMQERDAAEEINRNTEAEITFQSAWNVVQKFGEKQ